MSFYFNYFISKKFGAVIENCFQEWLIPRNSKLQLFQIWIQFAYPALLHCERGPPGKRLPSVPQDGAYSKHGLYSISSGENSSPGKHFITHCHFRECNTLHNRFARSRGMAVDPTGGSDLTGATDGDRSSVGGAEPTRPVKQGVAL